MRLATIGWLLIAVATSGCGGSNSGAPSGTGGQGGSTGLGFDHMCTPTSPNSLLEGFFLPCGMDTGRECTPEARKGNLEVKGDISETCENATKTTWDPFLGIFTIRGKLSGKTKSECGLVIQFGATSEFQQVPDDFGDPTVPPVLVGKCGALPNSAQYTRTDNAETGLNTKTYQLTSGALLVFHMTDIALGTAVSLRLERVTISPDETPEQIQIAGSLIACAKTPDANDGGICPAL